MRRIDAFSLFAGSIGLIVDFIGIGGLIAVSKTSTDADPIIWVLSGLLILYSIAFVSFSTRKLLFKRYVNRIRTISSNEQLTEELEAEVSRYILRVDRGTSSTTLLVGVPLFICFALAAAYIDSAESRLDQAFLFWPGMFGYNRVEYVLKGGFLYGTLIGLLLSSFIDLTMLSVYRALDPDYP